MFSFDRLKIDQIPLYKNKYRIKYLTEFRDLLNDAFGWNRTRSGDLEQQRIVINKRKQVIGRMIRLAGINTQRSCARRGASAYSTCWPISKNISILDNRYSTFVSISSLSPPKPLPFGLAAGRFGKELRVYLTLAYKSNGNAVKKCFPANNILTGKRKLKQ